MAARPLSEKELSRIQNRFKKLAVDESNSKLHHAYHEVASAIEDLQAYVEDREQADPDQMSLFPDI